MAAAQSKGVEIWDEAQFLAALQGGGKAPVKKTVVPKATPKPKGAPKGKGKRAAAAQSDDADAAVLEQPAKKGKPPPKSKGGKAPAAEVSSSAEASDGGGRRVDRHAPSSELYSVVGDYDVKLMQVLSRPRAARSVCASAPSSASPS